MKKPNFTRLRYREIMKNLTLEVNEYLLLKRAFQGGFTHANPFMANRVIENVTSFDFTSSYPAVMVAEKFPMTKGRKKIIRSKKEFIEMLNNYCCVFDVRFTDLQPKIMYDSYISESRCWNKKNVYANNGRVVSADEITTSVTGEDWRIIQEFYTWKKREIGLFYYYGKGYLPTDFVKAILKLYADKTTLKNVEGKESEYLNAKEMLNSCYGMTVTDICRASHPYGIDEWEKDEIPDIEKEIDKYNKSSSRFLFYPWGVWVTAYARRNLFSGIIACQDDYIYSDTDAIKIQNAEKYKAYFDEYNTRIIAQLKKACDFHKIDYAQIMPKTIKGVEKPLGVWDFDGFYTHFKTIGAKRYLCRTSDGEYHLTVSGLNKKVTVPYMKKKYGEKIFVAFSNRLEIPKGATGKMTHTYIDDALDGVITDYLGNVGEYHEKSVIHLEDAEYNLSMSQKYIDYILSIQGE